MEFTEEQRKRIDSLLEEAKEEQKINGNKTYTHEQFWNIINKYMEELKNERIQD